MSASHQSHPKFSRTTRQSRRAASRRGVSIYYTVLMMAVMCAFCSLAVDFGRLQVVKIELARAADAAARAGASTVSSDIEQARALAMEYAQKNNADGTPVVLDPSQDISFGHWDAQMKQFTTLSGPSISTADAIRVTARRIHARGNATQLVFARVLGINSSDVSATAIAQPQGPPPTMNIVGLDSVRLSGSDRIDSYNSALGSYNQTVGSAVNVASGEEVSTGGSSIINGNAYVGAGGSVSGDVRGTTNTLSEALNYPVSVVPTTCTNIGAISLGGGQSKTLTAGSYLCPSLSLSGNATLNIVGAVKLYVQGVVTINGNGLIAVAGNIPANFEIYGLGTAPINLGQNDLYAAIYAPSAPVYMNGNSDLFGSVIAKSIAMNGTNTIHYDAALTKEPAGPQRIVLVK